MATEETSSVALSSPDITLQIKEILKCNGITDPISEVIFQDSGLQGENFGGSTEYVIVKFEDPNISAIHLFTKRKTNNVEYNQMLDDWQAFQKEAIFFREYLPIAREYCKSLG